MVVRFLLMTCLSLGLVASPVAALADKPANSSDDQDEEKRRAAEKKKARAEKKRRAIQRRKHATEKKKRAAETKKREVAKRRAAEQARREARQRRLEQAKRREAAEQTKRREAAEQAKRRSDQRREEQRRSDQRREEQRRSDQRREAEAQRRRDAEARRATEAQKREAARVKSREAQRRLQARRAEADAQRKAEAIAAAEEEAEARAAALLAAQAERRAAQTLDPPPLPAPRTLDPATERAAAGGGASTIGRAPPARRPDDPPLGRRPIPRPDGDPDEPTAEHRQPIPRPDGDVDGPAEQPQIGRRGPETRPRRDGPRRSDRSSPGESRDRWNDTVDRVADEAGRGPPDTLRPVPRRRPEPRRRPSHRVVGADDGFADRDFAEDERWVGTADPAPRAAPDTSSEPVSEAMPGGPIGQQSRALSAESPGPRAASPDVQAGARPLPMPLPGPPAERSVSDWFDGFSARGAYAGWSFHPVGDLPGGAETFERYTAEALDLYRIDAVLDTRWARLQARYESNRGFGIGRDDALLDLLVGVRAVPGLEGLTFEYLDLDFVHGRVDLVDAGSGEVIETTPLKVDWRTIDITYPLHSHMHLLARRFDTVMPRNVYLEAAGQQGAVQISEQLLEVQATAWAAGLKIAKADDGEGLFGGITGWVGVGPYDIRTVSRGAFLDGGWLTAGGADAHIGWRQPLGAGFSLGVHDTLTLVGLDPNGLPSGMQRDLDAQGLASSHLSLRFGTLEVLNGLHFDLTWSI